MERFPTLELDTFLGTPPSSPRLKIGEETLLQLEKAEEQRSEWSPGFIQGFVKGEELFSFFDMTSSLVLILKVQIGCKTLADKQ